MSIANRFARFDRLHPYVWKQFVALALRLIMCGVRRYSADALLHQVRWGDRMRISNDFSACYARKFREAYPQHAGFFQYRGSQTDGGGPPGQGRLFDD